jgi:hypothetical protein
MRRESLRVFACLGAAALLLSSCSGGKVRKPNYGGEDTGSSSTPATSTPAAQATPSTAGRQQAANTRNGIPVLQNETAIGRWLYPKLATLKKSSDYNAVKAELDKIREVYPQYEVDYLVVENVVLGDPTAANLEKKKALSRKIIALLEDSSNKSVLYAGQTARTRYANNVRNGLRMYETQAGHGSQ